MQAATSHGWLWTPAWRPAENQPEGGPGRPGCRVARPPVGSPLDGRWTHLRAESDWSTLRPPPRRARPHGGGAAGHTEGSAVGAARQPRERDVQEVTYREAFAESFDPDETFGTVMAVDVLEHVDDVDRTLDMCARVLEPGGIFGFLTHNQTLKAFEELVWKGEYELGIIPKGNHDFHKFSTPRI